MCMYAYYILTLYKYIDTIDTCMTAVCVNVYMILFNVYVTALACLDGYERAATLITDRLQIAFTETCHLCSYISIKLSNF